jgi:hypothetical protein
MSRKNFKECILPLLLISLVSFIMMSCSSSKSQTPTTKYSIGGTVNGLSGTLVLQNNGGNPLTRTTNGSFTFTSTLAAPSAYSVTVSSQPSGQTCSVTNGSGTVSTANVTNVQVACVNNTYAVGGTVSGLSGTVVLQNNGGDDLSIIASGSFTFSTAVAHGAAYSVTVSSQPSGQTCSVTNASGTIGAANVTNVQVSCADTTYTVGGAVSGLSGTVVLQNNGSDDKTIVLNGSFTFNTVLTDGTDYSVAVLTQPSGQTCSVTNGSGTIGAANVTNVQISCADVAASGWTFPESLSDGISTPGGASERYAVDIANNGDAVIAYYDHNDSDNTYNIYKSERRNGVWTYPQDLTDGMNPYVNTTSPGFYPDVAMADDGATVITWGFYDTDETNYLGDAFYKAEYRDDGTGNWAWTYPADGADRLNWSYGGPHEWPEVAMSSTGETVIAWSQNDINGYAGIYKSEFRDDTGTWENPTGAMDAINPNSSTYPAINKPSVAMNDSGDSIIAWRQRYHYDDDYRILISEYSSSSGTWNNPGNIDDSISPPAGDAHDQQVAVSNNGDAIVVWKETSTTYIGGPIYKSEKRNGTWTNPSSLDDYFRANGDHPQVAMDDNGNAIIVWKDLVDTNRRIFMQEYTTAGGWGAPVAISPGDLYYNPQDPKVAMAGNGDAIIIWTQAESTGSTSQHYDQLYMSEKRDGVWTHPSSVDDYISLNGDIAGEVGQDEDGPCLTINDNGDTIIIWKQHDGPVAWQSNVLIFKAEYKKP